MNKIYKVIYSKVKQCYVVVSELAKSHVKSAHGSNGQQKAALTMSVLLALGAFTFAFGPATAEAETKTKTNGSNFIGVERPDVTFDTTDNDSKYANYNGAGAHGANAITIGLKAVAADDTITIGDRDASESLGSVYIGRGINMPTGTTMPDTTDKGYWATSVGYQSDATGYGSIAIGSNAVANNSYDKDSTGHGITLRVTSGDGKTVTLNGKPDIQRASVAIGYGASADNGNIAIGSYSDASTDLRTAKTTDGQEIKSYLTDQKADSYVSVGKTNALRRISNVADGASASDVATVGQLQALSGKVGVYDAGFGIEIASDKDNKTNTISLNRNLGNDYNTTDDVNLKNDADGTSLILGGRVEKGGPTGGQSVTGDYGALGKDSVTVGGVDNTVETTGNAAVVVGGIYNKAAGTTSAVVGGSANDAIGNESAVFGGQDNDAYENYATISGGSWNKAYGNASSIFGGSVNDVSGNSSVAVGGYGSHVYGDVSVGIAGGSTNADYALAAGNEATVTVNNGTAIGYQATANKEGTVAFGHDKGDVYYTSTWPQKATEKDGKYYDAQNKEITKNQYEALKNADLTFNDYSQKPKVTENKYDAAAYNRLVKVADGQDDHDVVVMEQLKQYANKDALNLGNNIKVYKTDEKGNVQLDKDKKPVEDTDATTTAQKNSKDAWGKALGAGTLTAATAKDSNQLVTGNTLYDYDTPTGSTNYVKANNTTGQNLSALDAQVKSNADTLNDKTHNIKYYSVDDTTLPPITGYSNEGNDGAKGMGSIAAGFNTHADGIASTVAGSYSGIINRGNVQVQGYDLRGAAALSYGTFNINQNTDTQNTDTQKAYSGVANSIVGQANATTDSNAAIIYGAGNTITNSYRDIDISKFDLSKVEQDIAKKDAAAVAKDLQEAVSTSGGQVMVMGGGNNVENAYMSQVVGVGNTVKGNQVKNEKSEWVTDTSRTAIKDYDSEKSSQYNFVDGFQNELTNGKHDYIIGSNNKVSGDSTGTNQSNIVFGDNHKLTNQKNNVIIGSSDNADDETTASDVVAIGHNAKASAEGGVAIGSGSEATVTGKSTGGYDPATGKNSTATTSTWQATNAAVSIGTANGKVTRQINGVAAGTNDTDAVNVAQLKNATAGMTTKGLNFQGNNTAVTVHRDLGSTLTIKGNGTKDDSSYSADNIKVVGDANGSLTIMMDKEIKGDRITVGEKGESGKEGQAGKDGVDGRIGVNGKDGSAVVINGKDGSIGLNGRDGANGLTIKGAKGDAGVDGTDGHDGKDGMTRIVYEDHNEVTHKVATLDDGMKYAGDFGDGAAVKLDKTVNIKGNVKKGAKPDDFVDGNIAVVANKNGDNGELQIKLNKNLTGLNSATYTTTTGEGESAKPSTTTVDGNGLTIMNGPSITNNGVDAGKKAITNVGSGIEKDSAGKYTVTNQNKGNAANIGDVQNMVNEAVNSAADTTNRALAGKANVDASNIGANLKGEDAEKTTNENAWGSAIGTGKIEANNGQLVTGKTVYEYNKPVVEDGKTLNYVSEGKTTGQNLGALDAHVKNNADAIKKNSESIQNITNNVKNLSDNAVQYDKDSNKTKVTLGGEGGTTITNVKDGALSDSSKDAVNGKQLYNEQEARKAADQAITEKVTNNTNEITKIKNGDFTDASKTVIKKLSQDAVQVKAGDRIKVDEATDKKTGNKTYTISANNNGTVAKDDGNLISGDTLYKEVHVDKDGSYIKGSQTVGQNLSALDSGLKTTSDLIHTNTKGDTIQIGGNSTATKIDVNGKDGKGRIITGVVSDANDPNSAANVGYVNGITSASNEQIYRDMNMQYNHVENDISRAAAGSNALAALHPMQEFDPDDKAQYALGYGHYRNSNAGAVGVFYQPDENSLFSLGASFGNGDAGINAGVTFKFGPGGSGHHALTKTQMAKVIDAQSKEIDALKKDNADKDKRIDALEQKVNEILAKVEKDKA